MIIIIGIYLICLRIRRTLIFILADKGTTGLTVVVYILAAIHQIGNIEAWPTSHQAK